MKVRVRYGSTTKVIPIDDEVANFVQLSELRRLIHEAFGDSLTGSFSLSLNKTDIFKDETQTLKDYEIVSGDLLHIISDSSFAEPNQKKTKPLDPQMNASNTIKDSTSSKDPENTSISTVEIEPEAATSQSTCGFDTSYSPQYISGDKISLQMLLSETPPKNLHQSLIVALHYLMLDSGFYLCDLNIMSHLDVKSLSKFSQVCRHLWILSQDNLLWRTLCQRDFKGCDTTDVANDWRKKYKGLYQSQKRTEVLRGPLNPLCFQMPHPFCFPPPAPQPSPFSTIGGDYDLQPAYFSTRSRLFRDPFM
ncbi:F-box only protein 7 isoform X1 [Octopus vulgaris]|uniref:F-box only protein 7 isoform X1 n=1 Tax=Octopus vulgaris TaxID=6645 RepID=A0AA36AVB1_OCTVU|nr:F-box only protein 7 isoform X1 [Octopus vulgaris]